jgi:hypothetical protein
MKCRTGLRQVVSLWLRYVEQNQGLHHQIMWNLRSSEILHSADWQFHTDILGQPISPTFKGQEIQKTEYSTTEVKWHNLLFMGLCPSPNFLKMHDGLEASSVSILSKETPNLVHPWELRFSIAGHQRNSNLLRYVPENRFSPRVVKGTRLVKN